jgi:hypothetical protein
LNGSLTLTPPLRQQHRGELAVLAQIWIRGRDRLGHLTRLLQYGTVAGQAGECQIGQARLTGSEHLARAAESQIHLSDFESI